MTSMEASIARARSLEAELATEQVATRPTSSANQHAVQLHTEAARWHREAGDHRRALRHDVFAKVHARLVARLRDQGEVAQ